MCNKGNKMLIPNVNIRTGKDYKIRSFTGILISLIALSLDKNQQSVICSSIQKHQKIKLFKPHTKQFKP